MWWIIIGILVFVLIKFTSDTNKQADAVAKQGGMRKKYKQLVDFALGCHNQSHIVREDGTSITIGCGTAGGSTYFDIVQGFGNVIIRWRSTSIVMGNHKLEWTFNEFHDQNMMIERINHDVDVYMSNVLENFS